MSLLIDARYVDGSPSGIGRYTEHVTRRLIASGLDVKVVVRTVAAAQRLGAHRHVVWDVEPNGPRTLATFARHVDTSSHRAFWSPFNILPHGIATRSAFTLHDVMWLKDPSFCTESRWRRAVTGTFYRHAIPRSVAAADALFTVSHTSREDIEALFPQTRGRVHVTYNAVDPSFAPLPPGEGWATIADIVAPETPFVLAIGQGSPYKNHGRSLAAFFRAFEDVPEAKFVLIRRFERGPDPLLQQQLAIPEVAARVVRLDVVAEDVLKALLARATVFAFPSLYEGFGMPSLEAMASGTPVVTSNFGAMAEVSGGAALEVDPRDLDAIATAMRRVYDDNTLAETLRKQGLARAAQFNWDATAAVVQRVLMEDA